MLLPQIGAGGVQGGGLVDELPGLAQVPGTVGLVGGHGGAVGLLALRGTVGTALRVCLSRRVRLSLGSRSTGLAMAAGVARVVSGCLGSIRVIVCHAVEGFVDVADPCAGGGEFFGVREGLADAAASVGHLAAGVVDVSEHPGFARVQFG